MFNEVPIVRALRLAFIGGLTGVTLVTSAIAQTTSASGPTVQQGERIEVTGSNIRRVQSETASPVQTLTRQDIERSGKSSVAELLQTLAVDNAGSVPKSFGNGFASGGSGISLRGLGAGATLVLLNGRRVAPYALADDGTKTFTDLNLIPIEAVERVEILKDGGSAVYGSDAIAGVVNIILRKEFQGLVLKGSIGQSLKYGDGRDTRLGITGGFGNLDADGYNVLANFEYNKKEPIYLSNRTDRGYVGYTDLRQEGFTGGDGNFGSAGTGAIGSAVPGVRTAAGRSIIGNVRNPTTLSYYSRDDLGAGTGFTRQFPGARCANFTSHTPQDPNGGCVIDASQQYTQVLPKSEEFNIFARGSLKITNDINAYAEVNYYEDRARSFTTPSNADDAGRASPTGAFLVTPGDLAANHPDNPYFGSVARLRYLTTDVGPRRTANDSHFSRFLVGLRGTVAGWDFDTGALYSRNQLTSTRSGFLQADVLQALLNPTGLIAGSTTVTNAQRAAANSAAYAALPAGTFYRIGENAGLNSPALYNALTPNISSRGESVTALADFKVSRELWTLPGGALGVAAGTEFRHESNTLTPVTGTERANIIGLGYSAYDLSRNVTAAFAEVVAPVIKQVELTAAARYDHYSDFGNAFTPKAGIKITPIQQIAIRGTFQRGFRAPNAPEAGGGTSAFSTSSDPVRCAAALAAGLTPTQFAPCSTGNVAIVSSGNPNLQPEHSKVFTGGFVLDPTPTTTISADYFKIIRKNEIKAGIGSNESYVLAGNVTRDPTNVDPRVPGDPGTLVSILQPYTNANRTIVRGLDVDARQDVPLGAWGKLSFGAQWTHLFQYAVVDAQGNLIEYAGTHGDCNVSNCIGTVQDRINAAITYSMANWSVSMIGNYRASIDNKTDKNAAACATFKGGSTGQPSPEGCRVGSFTTFDLTSRWQINRNWEVNGSIQNLFDRKPPFDPLTYGAVEYNPLDYMGAVGRFFQVGARYKF